MDEQSLDEMTLRVIRFLIISRAVASAPKGENTESHSKVLTELVNEMLPSFRISTDATPEVIGAAISQEIAAFAQLLLTSFGSVFAVVGQAHDAGTDSSTDELLVDFALELQTNWQ